MLSAGSGSNVPELATATLVAGAGLSTRAAIVSVAVTPPARVPNDQVPVAGS